MIVKEFIDGLQRGWSCGGGVGFGDLGILMKAGLDSWFWQ